MDSQEKEEEEENKREFLLKDTKTLGYLWFLCELSKTKKFGKKLEQAWKEEKYFGLFRIFGKIK